MGCSFLTTAYHGHLLPSPSWTSLLSPCKAILESSWEHLMCNLMINWCLRTWCILLSNVGMDQVSGLLNQPNVFGIFLGTKNACSIHQAIRLPDLVPNESYSFISPGETSLVHTIQAIASISWTSWTKTLLIYIYYIITMTLVSRTFIIHIELPCVQHLYCSERMYPKNHPSHVFFNQSPPPEDQSNLPKVKLMDQNSNRDPPAADGDPQCFAC